jgi:hypothetical protein
MNNQKVELNAKVLREMKTALNSWEAKKRCNNEG